MRGDAPRQGAPLRSEPGGLPVSPTPAGAAAHRPRELPAAPPPASPGSWSRAAASRTCSFLSSENWPEPGAVRPAPASRSDENHPQVTVVGRGGGCSPLPPHFTIGSRCPRTVAPIPAPLGRRGGLGRESSQAGSLLLLFPGSSLTGSSLTSLSGGGCPHLPLQSWKWHNYRGGDEVAGAFLVLVTDPAEGEGAWSEEARAKMKLKYKQKHIADMLQV